MKQVYTPSDGLGTRINRRLTPFRNRKTLKIIPGKTIISFSFDDCPVSGIENGVNILEQEGWLSTVYVSTGLFGSHNHLGRIMNNDDAKALHKNGHEIGEHSFSHHDANSVDLSDMLDDIERNQAALAELGLPPSETIAYPFGETNAPFKKVMSDRFRGARGIKHRLHKRQVDLNQIGSLPLFSDSIDLCLGAVKSISQSGGWVTFFTHDVRDNPSDWGCTPEHIRTMIDAVKETGAEVLPIKDAISVFEAAA